MRELYRPIGERLRAARHALRLSRSDLVERMRALGYRTSVASLREFENGNRLNLEALLRLAEVLERSPSDLLGIADSRDLGLEGLRELTERSSHLSLYEKEFLYAAMNHVELLRSQGNLPDEAPRSKQAAPNRSSVRQTAIAFLERGGAFSLQELSQHHAFAAVPEMLLHRTLQDLLSQGVVQAVTHRPTRFALRAEVRGQSI